MNSDEAFREAKWPRRYRQIRGYARLSLSNNPRIPVFRSSEDALLSKQVAASDPWLMPES